MVRRIDGSADGSLVEDSTCLQPARKQVGKAPCENARSPDDLTEAEAVAIAVEHLEIAASVVLVA